MRNKTLALIAAAALPSVAVFFASLPRAIDPVFAANESPASYDKTGNLQVPANYREWIYLSTGIDMSYTEGDSPSHSMFDNVFVNPAAYRNFMKTGSWPDKTEFVLEVRAAQDRGSINLRGHYEAVQVKGIEVHVKDESRFPGKWGFYEVDPSTLQGKFVPRDASCYSCHSAHDAVDTTFVQFYPTLLPIAQQKHTLSKEFSKNSQDEFSTQSAKP